MEENNTERQPEYTDPNESVKDADIQGEGAGYRYSYVQNPTDDSQQYTYAGQQHNGQFQNTNYQQSQQFQNTNYQQFQNTADQQSRQYQEQYQAVYQQQYQNNYDRGQMDTSPMSMGDWLLTILAALLPCAGVILYFIWAFSSRGNMNRRNYCRAMLIVMGALLVIYIIIFMVIGVIGSGYYYYY